MAGQPDFSTLLTCLNEFSSQDTFSLDGTHLFSSSSDKNISSLSRLLEASVDLSRNMHIYSSVPLQNTKTVSMLRQHAGNVQTQHLISKGVREIVNVPSQRLGGLYGEDIPHHLELLGDWFAARVAAWGRSAGMDAFPPEDDNGDKRAIVLAGKILVLDVELRLKPNVEVLAVKTTFAVSTEGSQTAEGSASIGEFLVHVMQPFLVEARKGEHADAMIAAKLGQHVQDGLQYLMRLEQLALKEGAAGIRWFRDIDNVGSVLENVAKKEADIIRASDSQSAAPLDLFLQRGHGLALPYLITPSLSFLIHMSPRVYLAMQKSSPLPKHTDHAPVLDVSLEHLRSILSSQPQIPGIYSASMALVFSTTPLRPQPANLSINSRPTFLQPLDTALLDHSLMIPNMEGSRDKQTIWCLDFTSDKRSPGIVMAQSRMREIAAIVSPLDDYSHMGQGPPFGSRNWVDMVINPTMITSPERYTAIFSSPSKAHPPLELRLGGAQEPGFLLERVQVYNMREIWGILEIVQEQCWLNEQLMSCAWTADDPANAFMVDLAPSEATKDELDAVLNGTIMPIKIPVNVYIPTTAPAADSLFDSTLSIRSRAAIHLTSPERAIPGLVEIAITHDVSRPRGVSVEVRGAIGADISLDIFEEATRRGGLFGIPGRVWAKASSTM